MRDSWKNWIIILGLLVFAGLASAGWLWLSEELSTGESKELQQVEEEPVVITLDVQNALLGEDLMKIPFIRDNIDGLQLTASQAIILAAVVTVFGVGAIGVPLAILSVLLGRQSAKVYADESYQAHVTELENRKKAWLKEWNQEQPVSKEESPVQTSRWSKWATSIVILIFVWIGGLLLGNAIFQGEEVEIGGQLVNPVAILNLFLILLTVVTLVAVFRSNPAADPDSNVTDYRPVNWGWVWVVLSGVLIVGMGIGLAVAMRPG
jgi:hypothetical protein